MCRRDFLHNRSLGVKGNTLSLSHLTLTHSSHSLLKWSVFWSVAESAILGASQVQEARQLRSCKPLLLNFSACFGRTYSIYFIHSISPHFSICPFFLKGPSCCSLGAVLVPITLIIIQDSMYCKVGVGQCQVQYGLPLTTKQSQYGLTESCEKHQVSTGNWPLFAIICNHSYVQLIFHSNKAHTPLAPQRCSHTHTS